MKRLGMTWKDEHGHEIGFVSKTIVYPPRRGNMPMRSDLLTPRERLIPQSIVVKPLSGHVLNAVGLTGPGAEWALGQSRWQTRTEPFMISFMSVAKTLEERRAEARNFVTLMKRHLPDFQAPFAIQFNRACPNSGHLPSEFYEETNEMLDILSEIGVPIVVNFNPVVPGPVMLATAEHPACAALWIGNTIPWGDAHINWQEIFGTTKSPLAGRPLPVPGGGGLSGPACLPHTLERVMEARDLGITKPIVAGNGIQHASDAILLRDAGADAVAIGSVGIVRPWRMGSIIEAAQQAA